MYRNFIKRLLDIVLSALGLIILSPVLLIVYILVILFLGFPAFFKQERPGKNEKLFKLYKFRTMTSAKDKNGKLLPDPERLTKFGRFLRSTSIDELPELFNIFKGDMSIVGPRPLLVRYLPYYTKKERHRHDVRPGLTGLAQIHGRNLLEWDKRLEMDVEYAKKLSFKMDVRIVADTIKKVLKREDVIDAGTWEIPSLDVYRKGVKNER